MARTEKFLAKGSRIVIKQVNKKAQWYTTQKDVVIPAHTEATCPLSNEECRTSTVEKINLYFQARMLRTRVVLETGDVDETVYSEQFALFHYDVPSSGESANFSPCFELYPIAVRLTKSAWMMRAGDIPYALMGRMEDMGCRVHVNLFDKSETRSLIQQAVEELQRQVQEAQESAQESYDRANAQLDASGAEEGGISEEEATERFLKRTTQIEKRLSVLSEAIAKGAKRFGISDAAFNRVRLGTVAKTVASSASARAAAYTHGAATLALVGTPEATAMANLAANSQLPFSVLSDALRDAGKDAEADAINETFDLSKSPDLKDDEVA